MLDHFRLQYPQGGLRSEFLGIEHGLFVVCVTVEVEGNPLGNGLAAAPTLEEAEDRARIRALETVLTAYNRTEPALPMAIAPTPQPATPKAAAPPNPEPILEATRSPELMPEITLPEPEIVPSPVANTVQTLDDRFPPEPELPFDEERSAPLPPETVEFEAFAPPLVLEPALEITPPEPTIALPPAPEKPSIISPPDEAIDFSEVIARSNRELKRLGWTSEQGRNYLLQTYGKRSRQLLSDEELLEFVQFLEKEPSPARS